MLLRILCNDRWRFSLRAIKTDVFAIFSLATLALTRRFFLALLSRGDSVLTIIGIRPLTFDFRLATREQHAISLAGFPRFVATEMECNTLRVACELNIEY